MLKFFFIAPTKFIQDTYHEILDRLRSKTGEYQLMIYSVHVIILTFMAFVRKTIKMIDQLRYTEKKGTTRNLKKVQRSGTNCKPFFWFRTKLFLTSAKKGFVVQFFYSPLETSRTSNYNPTSGSDINCRFHFIYPAAIK